jgi:hypothetical protein
MNRSLGWRSGRTCTARGASQGGGNQHRLPLAGEADGQAAARANECAFVSESFGDQEIAIRWVRLVIDLPTSDALALRAAKWVRFVLRSLEVALVP